MEKARREEMRWLVLFALREAQEVGLSELLIRTVMLDVMPDATELEIRRVLDYLAERKLITIEKNRPQWFAKIGRYGIDVAEYTVDCDPGIARPAKWQ
jgi:hypothetical protein